MKPGISPLTIIGGLLLGCGLLTGAGMYIECGTLNPVGYVREKRRKIHAENLTIEKEKQKIIQEFEHEQYLFKKAGEAVDENKDGVMQANEVGRFLKKLGYDCPIADQIPYFIRVVDGPAIKVLYSNGFLGGSTEGHICLPKSKLEEFLTSQ